MFYLSTYMFYGIRIGIFFILLTFVEVWSGGDPNEPSDTSLIITFIIFPVIYYVIRNYFYNKNINSLPLGYRLIHLHENMRTGYFLRKYKKDVESNKKKIKDFNEQNEKYFETVKDHVLKHLTKTYLIHQDEIKKIEDQIKQISSKKDETVSQLSSKIEDEKISTQKLMKKHPFLKTLEDIQNRT